MDEHPRNIPTHRSRGTIYVAMAADGAQLSDVTMRQRAPSRWLRLLLVTVFAAAAVAVLLGAGGLL
jgi:hypothetical protein